MKKIIKYIVCLFGALSLSSCERDLDPNLYSFISTSDFYKTTQDIDAATTTIYHKMRLGGWAPYMFSDGSSFIMDEISTGEWTTKWAWNNFMNGSWVDEAMTTGFYNWIAPSVTLCTYTMACIEDSPVEEQDKSVYYAQVRALRAFFVYDIYRLYGPMPLIVDRENALNPDPDYKPERPSAESVQQFLVAELRAAADALPVEHAQFGRVTKGAALHYLLKYYMHHRQWQEALSVANEIIGLNYYRLETDYEDIFSINNEKNREIIFSLVSEPLADYGSHTHTNVLPGDFASPYGNSLDGWNGHRIPWNFYDSFRENDKRRNLIWAEYQNKSGNTIDLRATDDIGALPLKYGLDPNAVGVWSGSDKILDRYAEVLLFKAEALNELNGPNQESIDLINEIRRRAFGGGAVQPDETLIEEEFDGEFEENRTGRFSMNNYDTNGTSAWRYDIDPSAGLSGENALHVYVENSGSEFWTLQIRAEDVPFTQGRGYKVSFKARASRDVTIEFRSEGPAGHTERISLKANEAKDVLFEIPPGGSGGGTVFFALGNTGGDYDLWIDAFKFEMKGLDPSGDVEQYLLKLTDVPDRDSLREWLLKERGWEFWYEGKRREDLIRMNKYIEEGKKHAIYFTEKNLLFPLPPHILIENPKLNQNPGY